MLFDAATEGRNVILGMLVVGLIFLAVIALGELVHYAGHRRAERKRLFPASGEINRRVPDGPAAIAAVEAKYRGAAVSIDYLDGLSLEFPDWRLNLRSSNTEPLIRLNVESRADAPLMQAKTAEILTFLASLGAVASDH